MTGLLSHIFLLIFAWCIPIVQADGSYVVDGNFEDATLYPAWDVLELGKHQNVSVVPQPGNATNHVMRIINETCYDSSAVVVTGHARNVVTKMLYNMTFNYMFESDATDVDWTLELYPGKGCKECYITLPTTMHYEKNATGNKWYEWKGTFMTPSEVVNGHVRPKVAPSGCSSSEILYMDNFILELA